MAHNYNVRSSIQCTMFKCILIVQHSGTTFQVFEPIKQLIPSLERPRKRLTELMVKTSLDPPSAKQKDLWSQGTKKWHLDLFRTPQEILPSASDPSSVGALRLGISTPTEDQSGLIDTGRSETIECGLVLKSIGYKSVQVRHNVFNINTPH